MDKFLLLRLSIQLCCFSELSGSLSARDNTDEIVQCRTCHLQFSGEKCSRGRGICTATTEEACAVGTIYKNNGILWLTFMGCLKNCANVRNIIWSVYLVNFRCCRGYDLCNENL
ncbi:prostate and testis expressed protein 1 [Carlito syrichta]|uniref:Prostate and testis expressed protein 1 n=1 Tax=Carlito syrichta TaxID=1868482 RepID=A0A1U7TBQ7_CARSF|nr:prostate and testis expressed protein 1 [Carlito syrichta]